MSVLLPNKPTKVTIDVGNPVSSNNFIGDSGISIYDNNTPNTNITFKTNNKPALYISDTQRIGINISLNPTKRLVINDELGETIRLMYNNNNYADINLDSAGSLIFKTYNNNFINLVNDINQPILKINNILVEASAEQINYNKINYLGIAEAKKALIFCIPVLNVLKNDNSSSRITL